MSPPRLQPALLGGLFIGVLSALPVVSIGNLCCCLWVIAGGALAAWVMQQNHPEPVTPADGAAVGFFAGLIGAFVYLAISWPVTLIVGPMMEEWFERAMEGAGDVRLREMFEQYRGRGTRTLSLVAGFLEQLVFGMLFATVGGILGAVLFKKAAPPPPPPPVPGPPAWTPPPPPALGPPSSPGFRGPGEGGPPVPPPPGPPLPPESHG
jgi:hypothetical protein